MLKFLFSTISALLIGIVGTLYTINWQEEKLVFELGETAKFGDVTYQNIRVRNEGWNPATNVSIQLQAEYISANEIKASPNFELVSNNNRIGGYERLRRNEVATLSFAFKGQPLTASMLTIKSDRSIATYKDPAEESSKTDWGIIAFFLVMTSFIVGLFSAIVIPAYKDYRKKVMEAVDQKAFEDGYNGK